MAARGLKSSYWARHCHSTQFAVNATAPAPLLETPALTRPDAHRLGRGHGVRHGGRAAPGPLATQRPLEQAHDAARVLEPGETLPVDRGARGGAEPPA